MRDFTQANLDAHLADLTQNLTPEQAAQVEERVHQRISSANLDLSPEAISGAFDLIGWLAQGKAALPDANSLGERLGGILGALDPRNLASGNLPGDALGGLGRLMGGAADLGGTAVSGLEKVIGGGADLGSGAIGAVGDLAGTAPDVGEATGALAGFVVEALGEVLSGSW